MRLHPPAFPAALFLTLAAAVLMSVGWLTRAQTTMPTVVDPNLAVRTVVAGLNQPTAMAFLGDDDFLILEKATGQVKRVTNGAVAATVLDLDVNFFSERGLLGIALHPRFPADPGVYLYWSESTTGADSVTADRVATLHLTTLNMP